MSTRRNAKIAQAIRQVVSTVVLFELRDPRIAQVTVLGTEVAEDLRSAKVLISVMGADTAQRLALQGLNSARGFIQSRIADELKLRQTPILSFALDQGVKQSIHVSKMLREAMDPSAAQTADDDVPADLDLADSHADVEIDAAAHSAEDPHS
jgi:ribosome-binding factor A